ncbi:MAG: hypothetical protein M1544_01360 [Candidatus Marsarchaeota archaeon]|nr:hypothetical protein [Candidatus Marsarchaeota archaeon]
MTKLKQIFGSVFIIIALAIFTLSYITYLNSYHKAVSSVSDFGFLFSGIFWFFVGIITGAVFFALGLIWVWPRGAKWLVDRGKGFYK